MAKKPKKNPPGRLITVKSKAYGEHQRAARGTYKPATLNPTMEKSAASTVLVNTIAKGIKDAHNAFCKGINAGPAWQRLLSIVRTDAKERAFNYNTLTDFEFDAKLTLTTLCVYGRVDLKKTDPANLQAEISFFFKLNRKRDSRHGFRLGLITSFFRPDFSHATTEHITKSMKSHEIWKDNLNFKIPEGAEAVVLSLNCELLENELDRPGKNQRAMRIVLAGNLQAGFSRAVTIAKIFASDYDPYERKR